MSSTSDDYLYVVSSGEIERQDRCVCCGDRMLYHVTAGDRIRVVESFCQNTKCAAAAFLIEIPEAKE